MSWLGGLFGAKAANTGSTIGATAPTAEQLLKKPSNANLAAAKAAKQEATQTSVPNHTVVNVAPETQAQGGGRRKTKGKGKGKKGKGRKTGKSKSKGKKRSTKKRSTRK